MKKELEILTPTEPWQSFAKEYFSLRQKEYRLPDDELLKKVPDVPANHPHASAWKMRKVGLNKLLLALKNELPKGGTLLDIGCGNGWMSNRIAEAGFEVTAIDVTLAELEQAHRVFARPGLRFAFADLFTWQPDQSFNIALLASSIQYFAKPKELLEHLFAVNPDMKTVFISDSPFYSPREKSAAAKRSQRYYTDLGYPEMAANYHHHSLYDLGYPATIVSRAAPRLVRKLIGGSPFPIVKVTSSL